MRSRVRARVLVAAVAVNAALLLLPFALRGDLRPLLGDAACCGLVVLSSLLCVADAATTRHGGDDRHPFSPRRVREQRVSALTGIALLVTFWLCIAARLDGTPAAAPLPPWAPAGAALMLGGIALRLAAVHRLGPAFVSEARVGVSQALETHGVYAVVRHPSEAGLLGVAFGAALLCGSGAAAGVALACVVPSCVARVLHEERKLAAAFGDEHDAYARSVSVLLPCVW